MQDRLSGDEMLVTGETGHHELVVLLFRSPADAEFYRAEIPLFVEGLAEALARHGHRVVYPYCRKAPIFGLGFTGSLRNPHFGVATQLRASLEEAREDARLDARIEARRRRKQLTGIVLAGEITSVYEPIVDVATQDRVRLRGARPRARGLGLPLADRRSSTRPRARTSSSSSTASAAAAASTAPRACPPGRSCS